MRPERVKGNGNAAAEIERLRKEVERAEKMLANERFVANAPADVVEAEREKLDRYRRELMPSQADWVESLSPWPEEFGLGRIRALLERLGTPSGASTPMHVVGSNGKSTATRTIAEWLGPRGGGRARTRRRT